MFLLGAEKLFVNDFFWKQVKSWIEILQEVSWQKNFFNKNVYRDDKSCKKHIRKNIEIKELPNATYGTQ